MISGTSNYTSGYLRFAPPVLRPASTPSDTQPDTSVGQTSGYKIEMSNLSQIKGLRFLSAADVPGLQDRIAKSPVTDHASPAVTNDVFQKTYAEVKVDGKVVATLFNSGTAMMTDEAADTVGDVADPPGLVGPDLAQWRADTYARLLGGGVEKAVTAIALSQSTPPQASYPASKTQAGVNTDFSA